MAENYILDNENYTEEEVSQAAKAKGLTVDDYIQQYYPDADKVEEQETSKATTIAEKMLESRANYEKNTNQEERQRRSDENFKIGFGSDSDSFEDPKINSGIRKK